MRGVALFIFMAGMLAAQGRVVVLGVDGLDAQLTQRFMAEGRMPELSRLAQQGAFRTLLPTNPAQSPVSWAAMTTGLGPGSTGIFGFLKRRCDAGGITPELAGVEAVPVVLLSGAARWGLLCAAALPGLILWWLMRRRHPRAALGCGLLLMAFAIVATRAVLGEVPESLPVPRNTRGGQALWEILDTAGVAAVSLRAPMAFPAPALQHGRLLTGLGTPDLLGTPGSWWIHGTDAIAASAAQTQMGGTHNPLHSHDDTAWEGVLSGPRNPLRSEERLTLPLMVTPGDPGSVQLGDSSVPLPAAGFSAFVPAEFVMGRLVPPLRGLSRFRLLREQPMRVFQTPLGIDPRAQMPVAQITAPREFGAELCVDGLFDTCGWCTATNPYQDECIDAQVFLEDVKAVLARDEALLMQAARRGDWRCLFSVIAAPDRVQHVAWSAFDTTHPMHARADAVLRDAIPWVYAEVDRICGRVMREVLTPDDTLLVVSDHGFAPFTHAVNLNRWLAEEGLLVLDSGERTLGAHLGKPVTTVDWKRTKAYHLGLGRIWLNRAGREPQGIVSDSEAAELTERLRSGLLKLRHEGRPVVRSVALASEIYRGSRVSESSDLVIGFERGYRTSWNACLLGGDEPVVFENRSRWSGDHCSVDPALVPGVLFASRPTTATGDATVLDVLPTVLPLLGLPAPAQLEGRDLGVQR